MARRRPALLIGGDKTDNTPRWSPDGRQLAFISTRDGDTQVYLANADGSNVRQLTKVSGGVQPPLVFAPDGSSLAFVSDVFPDCADEACNASHRAAADKNPVAAHSLTRLLYRHWDEWRDGVRHHVFVVPAGGGDARDLTPGDFDSPPTQQEDAAVAFTPDGMELVFVSNREGCRSRSVVDQQRRLVGAGQRRHTEEADARIRPAMRSRCSRETASS